MTVNGVQELNNLMPAASPRKQSNKLTYDDQLFMAPDPTMMMPFEVDELDQVMRMSAAMERIDSGTGFDWWSFGFDEKSGT